MVGRYLRAGTLVPICCGSSVQPMEWHRLLMVLSFGSGSAYCGGLWLAAVCMMCKMAEVLGDAKIRQKYMDILNKGKEAFERKLWNGEPLPVENHIHWPCIPWEWGDFFLGNKALQGMGGGEMPSLQVEGKEQVPEGEQRGYDGLGKEGKRDRSGKKCSPASQREVWGQHT